MTARLRPMALLLPAGISIVLVWLLAGLGGGSWHVPRWSDPLVVALRLPRIGNAMLVGAALSVAGAALQALFRNPLADPGLIGTSAGAALGVTLVLAGGLPGMTVPLAAFAGGLAATLAVLAFNRVVGGGLAGLLILGVATGAGCMALVNLLLLLSDDLVLRGTMSWLAGNLSDRRALDAWPLLLGMLAGFALLVALARDLDCLALGDDTAAAMGVRAGRVRLLTAVGTALLTAGAVTLAGVIGFIGMMVPNAVALCCRTGLRGRLFASAWAGALFLLLIDSVGREAAYPIDLPAGVVAALVGPAFFLWLFWRVRKEMT